MELGLQFEEMKCYSCVLDTVTRREETQESIVSDSMPDISDIIAVTGTPYLHQTRAENGMVTSEGEVAATVIYEAEGTGQVCSISVRLSFRCAVESAAVTGECRANAMLCLQSVDAKLLNPRKILVQAEVAVHFLVFAEQNRHFSMAAAPRPDLQTKTEYTKLQYVSHVAEKVFPVEDTVVLAAGHHGMIRLIGCDYVPYCSESKLVGRKIVMKGGVRISAKYLTDEGALMRETCELPVSQVLDAGDCGENGIPYVNFMVSDAECVPTDRGGLGIMLELYACAVLVDQRELNLMVDAYSTNCRCDCSTQTMQMVDLNGHGVIQHPFRFTLDAELPSAEVVMEGITIAEIFPDMNGRYRGRLKVSCCLKEASGRMTKLDQNGYIDLPVPDCVDRNAVVHVQLLDAVCIAAAGSVEVRGNLHISYISMTARNVNCLSRLILSEDDGGAESCRPSAVLRRLQPGETLWDIGKAHSATVEEIMLVNRISDENAAGGRFLLIPRSR